MFGRGLGRPVRQFALCGSQFRLRIARLAARRFQPGGHLVAFPMRALQRALQLRNVGLHARHVLLCRSQLPLHLVAFTPGPLDRRLHLDGPGLTAGNLLPRGPQLRLRLVALVWWLRLNADEPFDEFTRDQLAGDLLPNPTTEQLVATGFHRNTLANEEGGTDDEQFRTENVVDRVSTTSTVWLGLTLGCAQCHDHKFDPLSQRDFYRFFAILNNTADNNDANGLEPKLLLPSPQQAETLRQLTADIAVAEENFKAVERERVAGQPEWEASLTAHGEPLWEVVHPEAAVSTGGATLDIDGDGTLLVGGRFRTGMCTTSRSVRR